MIDAINRNVRKDEAFMYTIAAIIYFILIPWYLGAVALRKLSLRVGVRSLRYVAGYWSFALSTAVLFVVFTIDRIIFGRVEPIGLIAAWGIFLVALGYYSGRAAFSFRRLVRLLRRKAPILIPITAATLIGLLWFAPQQYEQCFNGDGVEGFTLADSVRDYVVPHWEIEPTVEYGIVVVNPSLLNSYWTATFQTVLGDAEWPTRLGMWIWWPAALIVLADLALVERRRSNHTRRSSWLVGTAMGLLLLLLMQWYSYYCGYYPWLTDPANPGVTDGQFTFWICLALAGLRRGSLTCFAVMMVAASLVLYAGPVMLVLLLVGAMIWPPMARMRLIYAFAAAGGTILLIAAGYLVTGWVNGWMPGWITTIDAEYITDIVPTRSAVDSLKSTLNYVIFFLAGTGGIGLIALIRPYLWRASNGTSGQLVDRRAWRRTVAFMLFAYLALVLTAGEKNLHYLPPLLPITVLLWIIPTGQGERFGGRDRSIIVACIGLFAVVLIGSPQDRTPFTLNRSLGNRTHFAVEDYAEACVVASTVERLCLEFDLPWEIGKHTLLHYSRHGGLPASQCVIGLFPSQEDFIDAKTSEADGSVEPWQILYVEPSGVIVAFHADQWKEWLVKTPPPQEKPKFPFAIFGE